MVKLTKSMKHWLYKNHPDLISPIMFGHLELFTDEMQKEYIEWCKTEDGKRYLKGGDLYDDWLEELKVYQQHEIICNKGYNAGYNKAIDDCIKEVDEEKKQHNHTITKDCLFWLKRKFEQLKAGGENDN